MADATSVVGIDFVANTPYRGMLEHPPQGPTCVSSVDPAGRQGGNSDPGEAARGRLAYAAPTSELGTSHIRGEGSKLGRDVVGESASDLD